MVAVLAEPVHVAFQIGDVDIAFIKELAGISLLFLRQALRGSVAVVLELSQERVEGKLFIFNATKLASKGWITPVQGSHLALKVIVKLGHCFEALLEVFAETLLLAKFVLPGPHVVVDLVRVPERSGGLHVDASEGKRVVVVGHGRR